MSLLSLPGRHVNAGLNAGSAGFYAGRGGKEVHYLSLVRYANTGDIIQNGKGLSPAFAFPSDVSFLTSSGIEMLPGFRHGIISNYFITAGIGTNELDLNLSGGTWLARAAWISSQIEATVSIAAGGREILRFDTDSETVVEAEDGLRFEGQGSRRGIFRIDERSLISTNVTLTRLSPFSGYSNSVETIVVFTKWNEQ